MGCCNAKAKGSTNKDDAGNEVCQLKKPALFTASKKDSPIVERLGNNFLFRKDEAHFTSLNPDEIVVDVNPYQVQYQHSD